MSADAGALACPNCGAPVCEDQVHCRHCGSELQTALCTACRARVFVGHAHCPQCGAVAALREIVAAHSPWACPRCAKPLRALRHAGEVLDECPACGGFFVLKEVFAAISRDQAKRAQAQGLPGRAEPVGDPTEELRRYGLQYLRCPVCEQQMARHNFARRSGIIVDVCRAHGIWFDPDEIQAILKFIQAGGLERSGPAPAAARKRPEPLLPDRHPVLPPGVPGGRFEWLSFAIRVLVDVLVP